MAKILIVDDSAAYRLKLRSLVRKLGHETLLARSGEEALELAQDEHPGVILMDIVMPGMNGYEAKRALARDAETREIPVIFVTSQDEEADRVWGMRQGATAYIVKPVDSEQLERAIARATTA